MGNHAITTTRTPETSNTTRNINVLINTVGTCGVNNDSYYGTIQISRRDSQWKTGNTKSHDRYQKRTPTIMIMDP